MDIQSILMLALLIFAGASLYSAVGHAGASGYLAAMALFGLAPMEMKPAALTLNILVAVIAVTQYLRAGRFNWSVFWPFAIASIPFAYLGGLILLPSIFYKPVIGLILLYAAYRFLTSARQATYNVQQTNIYIVLLSGSVLGFLSGLVGVGGGIFLSPLLIMLRWETVKNVSGIAAAFILVNSIAGLLGFMSTNETQLPEGLAYWAIAAMAGGFIGSTYGSQRFASLTIKRLLALVLLIAGIKMFLTI